MRTLPKVVAFAFVVLVGFAIVGPSGGSGRAFQSTDSGATPDVATVPADPPSDATMPPAECAECLACEAGPLPIEDVETTLGAQSTSPGGLRAMPAAALQGNPNYSGITMTFPGPGVPCNGGAQYTNYMVGRPVKGTFDGGPLNGCTFEGNVDTYVSNNAINFGKFVMYPSRDPKTGVRSILVTCKANEGKPFNNDSTIRIYFFVAFPGPENGLDPVINDVGKWNYVGQGTGDLAKPIVTSGFIEFGRFPNGNNVQIQGFFNYFKK
jgi:hypothetical protein